MGSAGQTLWELTAGQRKRYTAAIAAMAAGTVFLLLVPFLLKFALDSLQAGQAAFLGGWFEAAGIERDDVVALIWATGALLVGFYALHGFFTYLRGKWAAEASEGIVRRLRHRLYEHLERLPASYYDGADTGDLVQRCSSDVETVRVFLAAQVVEIARVALLAAVAVPIMLSQDVAMTFVTLALVPHIVWLAARFFRQVRNVFLEVDESEGRLTTVLQENLTGIRVVRAFARQDHEIEKFLERNGEFRDLEYDLFVKMSRFWSLSDILVFSQLGLALFAGALFVQSGSFTFGTLVLFWWLLRQIIWPVRHIGRTLADAGKATVAIGRIREILETAEESVEPTPDEAVHGAIEVRGLTFAYGDDAPAIRDLDLRIEEGETVALLGPPGAGKSTLVHLLARLYDYSTGSIRIGGRELSTVQRDAVRAAFGVVLQDPFLYSKTVRENVVLGHGAAGDHEVVETARAAGIHGNIEKFENGYDTMVGERGVTLSGGQRQRLAIARALLKDPAFLVLDDSLSAVDTKTEAHILRSLAARRGRQTTILIAHRLSSTRLADRIFVLDEGRLVQEGTHDELLAEEGPYRRLWRIQGALEEEIERDLSGAETA